MKVTILLKQLRKQKGWTQEKTALQTGISIDHIKSIESGRSSPSLRTIETIATTFGCDAVEQVIQVS